VGATAGPQQHDEADLQRMREELFAPATPGSAAFDTAIEPALAAPAEVGSGQMQASVADTTGRQSTYQRVLLLPEQQSSQYAELRQRLEQLERDRASLTDEQAHSAFLEAQRLNQKEKPAPPKPASPSGESLPPKDAPDAPAAPHDVVAQAAERVRRPPADPQVAPLPIETLAEGVPAEGLRGLLSSAEEQLRQGQYSAALDSYDKAARVSPGNPMIDLGRAHAELAAGLYGRAEAHLRQALLADKALLMGRYDLRQFYGEERLQTVVTDLRSVAQAEPNDARPMLLLAYVAYNAGNEPAADDYLAQAELRMGLTDPLCQLLREQWGLGREPSDAATQPSAPEPKID
jgi:cytochrome c-type biogenesis protein CcmH/NrfG